MFTPFYQQWLKEFDLISPRETKINCASCTMVNPPQNETLRDPGPFDAKLKCCTYIPFVPNFSLGRILNSNRLDLRSVVGTSALFSPLGLAPKTAPKVSENFSSVEVNAFGRDQSKRCPFLSAETSMCRIWESRPSVCASYHCVSSRGAQGLEYWKTAEELGNLIEWTLSHEALWSLGFSIEETDLMARALESTDEHQMSESWFEWRGREMELYQRAFEISSQVSASALRDSLGEDGESLILALQCDKRRARD